MAPLRNRSKLNKKGRLFEEIKDLHAKNPNFVSTEHAWVLENINHLQNYTSTNLQTWMYEAKILSGINQQ
jgi:hypothetical protein